MLINVIHSIEEAPHEVCCIINMHCQMIANSFNSICRGLGQGRTSHLIHSPAEDRLNLGGSLYISLPEFSWAEQECWERRPATGNKC